MTQTLKTQLTTLLVSEDGLSFIEFAGFVSVMFAAGAGMCYVGAMTLINGMAPMVKL